ncbi:Sensor histidine kinase LiaS [Variovorax sp. SRS16]|uniref:sensor histidine kinase n=1 Tax=Variovorax sp. SRS16 TaxID=282217 RepID=UPI001316E785|nr:histidine kinase [Variovorax sp. SRS16]VTU14099.1 Sensor histidine kinase LiaS [Variovorax sp. SRS16]
MQAWLRSGFRAGTALLLWCALAGAWAGSDLQVLNAATVTTTVAGRTQTEAVDLPYHWDRHQAAQPGVASFDLPFSLERQPDVPWGIYLARVGTSFSVELNGELVEANGSLAYSDGGDYAKIPRFIAVPARLLRPGDNLLRIRIRADTGRRAGLSAPVLGPASTVSADLFASAYAWRFSGSVLLAAFSLVVSVTAFALWLTQLDTSAADGRRREGVYLWAALAEFCWALRVADGAIANPPLPWVAWGVLMTACYSGWVVSAVLFCHHVAGWHRHASVRWMRWAMAVMFVGAVSSTWLSLARAEPQWLTGWLGFEIAGIAVYIGGFVLATVLRPNIARVLLSSVAVLTVLIGLRDWVVIRVSDSYGDTTWVRYTSVFFGIALLTIVVTRFRTASQQARELLATLTAKVADRERELAATYGRLERAAREQATALERQRILRDMHDGVGSHISAAIRQLQSGDAKPEELLRTLRDSLDQLKLSIDSIQLPPGDVGALLAALRYRLGSRFAASNIELQWAVDELSPVERLDAQAMRQLQFLLFEAISNVLQHAQATVLRIEAAMAGPALRLCVIDNGRGYDASSMPRAICERAAAIGAWLAVESRPGRTVVRLDID